MMTRFFRTFLITLAVLVATGAIAQLDMTPPSVADVGPAVPPEISENADDWPAPQYNLQGTRANLGSAIDAGNVSDLEVAWTWPIEASNPFAGGMTAPPLVVDDTIYVQDMENNVFALDRATGEVRWEKIYDIPTEGPNGVAIGYGMLFGGLGDSGQAFALDAETGEELWRVTLTNNDGEGIDMAPTVYDDRVYISTVPGSEAEFYEGGQRGIVHVLEADTGTTLWTFDTTTDNLWHNARLNSGGGLWYPPSVDADGNVYFGVGNPAPWPGLVTDFERYPNASSRPGPNDYSNSLVSLDPLTGSVRWYHNAKPHDLFDLDFQNTPVIATVQIDGRDVQLAIGSGKTGTVVAADTETGAVVWDAEVGLHQNDWVQEIPEGETIRVYPGALGGVETPIAYANGTVFVPVVNAWSEFTPVSYEGLQPLTEATGELVALDASDGSVRWQVELPTLNVGAATVANDVVFTATIDGVVRAYDVETGDELWTYQTNAGINAPSSVAGDLLVVPSAGPLIGAPEDIERQQQLIAFRLPGQQAQAQETAQQTETEAQQQEQEQEEQEQEQQQEGEEGEASSDGQEANASQDLAQLGDRVFHELANPTCASCHGPEGQGGIGPAFVGNTTLQDASAVITQILQGGRVMPGYADQLSAEQIAAVTSYIRTAWGNDYGTVSVQQVQDVQSQAQ